MGVIGDNDIVVTTTVTVTLNLLHRFDVVRAPAASRRPSMRYESNERDERSWQDNANCLGVDPDLFFPERGASTREAKEVCRGCVVREDCLEYALANGEKFGIWGGLSERERRRIRRQRALSGRRVASASTRPWVLDLWW